MAQGETMLNELWNLSPRGFEEWVAQYLGATGYIKIERIGGAGDLGVDILCQDAEGHRVAVQCKRYAEHRGIGSKDIQHFYGMAHLRQADRRIFITTSFYKRGVKDIADLMSVKLVDGADLSQHLLDQKRRALAQLAEARRVQVAREQSEQIEIARRKREEQARRNKEGRDLGGRDRPLRFPEPIDATPILPQDDSSDRMFNRVPPLIIVILGLTAGMIGFYAGGLDNERAVLPAAPVPTVSVARTAIPPTSGRLNPTLTPVRRSTARPSFGITPDLAPSPTPQRNCGLQAYPTVCIPPPPPDVGCEATDQRNFPVRQPDPHLLDPDFNGVGCEPI